jgi:hypothetical protein
MSAASEPTAGTVAVPKDPTRELEQPPSAATETNVVSKAAQELATLPPASAADPRTNPFGNEPGNPELGDALGVELATRVEHALAGAVPEELQQELAGLVTLIPDTLEQLGPEQLQMLRSAVRALLGEKPNFTYARELRGVLQKSIQEKKSPLRLSLWQKESPAILVVIGLGLFAYLVAPLALFVVPRLMRWGGRTSAMGLVVEDLVLITIIGALGSVTSIMARLQDFDTRYTGQYNNKPGILVLFGFFKPIIGMFFALFCYALLKAGLLPALVLPEEKAVYFYGTIAFIAGFSERFAGDIIAQVEKRASAVASDPVYQNGKI